MPYPRSYSVHRALRKLGHDLRDARKRRHLPMRVVAERALTSRKTLQRVEEGDPGVSMGIYCSVFQALGFLAKLEDFADIHHDPLGKSLSSLQLPQRVRVPSSSADTHKDEPASSAKRQSSFL